MVVFVHLILIQQAFHLTVLVQVHIPVNTVKFPWLNRWLVVAYHHVTMVVLVLMVYVCVHRNMLDHHVNIVSKKKKKGCFYFIENPCINNNPCLNSGTCFGRYNISGSLYTQCYCSQGYTGVHCECNMNEKQKKIWNDCTFLFYF